MAILDETLLAGLASGDRESAAAFVRRFQARVFGLAMSILHDSKAAEEVAQETFLRAWTHASAYDPRRGAVSTWLLTIARNIAIDSLRVRRASPVDPDALLRLEDVAGPSLDGDVGDRIQLRGALSHLPREQRRAVLLAAFLGYTAREIGEMDDVPVGTVKTRIRTAMGKLRSELGVKDDR
jgi:RNA polymerase sigma factor (sigma-70 family)